MIRGTVNSLVPHLTLYDQLGDMPLLGAIVGRGVAWSWLGARRGPESSPKVFPMTRVDLLDFANPKVPQNHGYFPVFGSCARARQGLTTRALRASVGKR